MKRQQRDIDRLFAQVRADSTPPALETLIQTQPSGSLVAVKKGASLFSSGNHLANLWWKLLAFGSVSIIGTVLYFSAFSSVSDSEAAAVQKSALFQAEASGSQQPSPSTASTPSVGGQAFTAQRNKGIASSIALASPSIATKQVAHGTHTKLDNLRLTALAAHRELANKHRTQRAVLGSETALAKNTAAENTFPTRETREDIGTAPLLASTRNFWLPPSLPEPQEAFPIGLQTMPATYTASLMIDGFSLLSDIVQVSGEFRSGKRTSYGVLFGVGNVQGATQDTSYSLVVAGAQFSYYLLGDFSQGLHVGAQATFSSTDARAKRSQYERGNTISLAPYAGYKFTLLKGFTLNAQAGVGVTSPLLSSAVALEQTLEHPPSQWRLSPRMHIGVGWSF